MAPLARLLVANGVTYTMFARALKPVFLQAAERELQSEGKRITDSALSLLSGVHRKDVRTLTADAQPAKRTVTIASQVTMAWTSQPEYLDADGHPRPLPMRAADADAPSFERLSQPRLHGGWTWIARPYDGVCGRRSGSPIAGRSWRRRC